MDKMINKCLNKRFKIIKMKIMPKSLFGTD